MNVLSTAWTVARKDLRLYLRDRTGMMLGFLLPIVLITVFGFIMKYAFRGEGGMPRATLWVADEDDSPQSRRLIEVLCGSEVLRVRPFQDQPAETARAMNHVIADFAKEETAENGRETYWPMVGYHGLFWEQWTWTHPRILTALAVQWGFAVVAAVAGLVLYRRRYVAG